MKRRGFLKLLSALPFVAEWARPVESVSDDEEEAMREWEVAHEAACNSSEQQYTAFLHPSVGEKLGGRLVHRSELFG